MNTLHLVAPEHRDLVGTFPDFAATHESLAAFRENLIAGFEELWPPGDSRPEAHTIPASDSHSVRVLLHRPTHLAANAPAILYIHGGGMIAGSAGMMKGLSAFLAESSGAILAVVDYRLAPETPFPGGLEDCYAALAWLHAQATELGIDATRISLMGDSAGGGLAAALALLARDRKALPIRAQILMYPMLDLRTGGAQAPSSNPNTGEFIWQRHHNAFAWHCVRGDHAIAADQLGYLSPALAKDLTGLPPAYLITGALDLFLEEDVAYAQRLLQAGVPTDLTVYAGAVHGFDLLPGAMGERARADTVAALQRLL